MAPAPRKTWGLLINVSSAGADMTDEQAKRDYVKQQKQTRGYTCHWTGCEEQVPPAMWGCRKHWFALPKSLSDKVWATYQPGQEVDLSPSNAYLAVDDEVEKWVREHTKTFAPGPP